VEQPASNDDDAAPTEAAKVENFFTALREAHCGHWISSAFSAPLCNMSKLLSQSEQRYSKIGMIETRHC
jgi:hypothetical protein